MWTSSDWCETPATAWHSGHARGSGLVRLTCPRPAPAGLRRLLHRYYLSDSKQYHRRAATALTRTLSPRVRLARREARGKP